MKLSASESCFLTGFILVLSKHQFASESLPLKGKCFFCHGSTALVGLGFRSHSDTSHIVGFFRKSDRPVAETSI